MDGQGEGSLNQITHCAHQEGSDAAKSAEGEGGEPPDAGQGELLQVLSPQRKQGCACWGERERGLFVYRMR